MAGIDQIKERDLREWESFAAAISHKNIALYMDCEPA